MGTGESADDVRAQVSKLGIDATRRHIFLPRPDQAEVRLAGGRPGILGIPEAALAGAQLAPGGGVYRTEANCLQVCMAGPIALVYPDGTWYRSARRRCSNGSSRNT
jgi:hypothetical protein